MHELEQKLKPIMEMKEKLTQWCKTELDKGENQVDTAEMGQVIDMIKDLAEAEEKSIKGAYYKCLVKEMKDEKPMGGIMGYDNWRTNSGRFANKGTGNYRPQQSGRRGYPMTAEGDWRPEYGPWGEEDMYDTMGYNRGGRGGSSGGRNSGSSGSGRSGSSSEGSNGGDSQGGSSGDRMGYSDPDYERIMSDERHGRPYREWKLSRRHYNETKSESDKQEMSEHAKEHISDTINTMKEIWMGADTDLKTKMKSDLTKLMSEMT